MSRAAPDEIFQNALGEISRFEYSSGGSTLKKPRDDSVMLSDAHKYQLVLSKLYTGNNTCAAIYFDSKGRALVSNNDGVRGTFDSVNKVLSGLTTRRPPDGVKDDLIALLNGTKAYIHAVSKSKGVTAASINPLLIRDVNFIVDNFKKLGRATLSKAQFVSDPSVRNIHAEMRLLGSVASDLTSTKEKRGFIATPKLMCSPCDEEIGIVNARLGIQIDTVGTHGRTYAGWKHAPGVSIDVRRELERRYITANKERTVLATRMIPDEPTLLSERGGKSLLVITSKVLEGRAVAVGAARLGDARSVAPMKGAPELADVSSFVPGGDAGSSSSMYRSHVSRMPAAATEDNEWWDHGKIITTLQYLNPSVNIKGPGMNEASLGVSLDDVRSSANGKYIILINMNAVNQRVPVGSGGADANHWGGIYVEKGDDGITKVVYIDPMGNHISPQVGGIIAERLGISGESIEQPTVGRAVQYTKVLRHWSGELSGNPNDCGAFTSYLLGQAISRDGNLEGVLPTGNLSEAESKRSGQVIRAAVGRAEGLDSISAGLTGRSASLHDIAAAGSGKGDTTASADHTRPIPSKSFVARGADLRAAMERRKEGIGSITPQIDRKELAPQAAVASSISGSNEKASRLVSVSSVSISTKPLSWAERFAAPKVIPTSEYHVIVKLVELAYSMR